MVSDRVLSNFKAFSLAHSVWSDPPSGNPQGAYDAMPRALGARDVRAVRVGDFERNGRFDFESAPRGLKEALAFLASRLNSSDWEKLQELLSEDEVGGDDEHEAEAEHRPDDEAAIDRRDGRAMDAAYGSSAERDFARLFPGARRVTYV